MYPHPQTQDLLEGQVRVGGGLDSPSQGGGWGRHNSDMAEAVCFWLGMKRRGKFLIWELFGQEIRFKILKRIRFLKMVPHSQGVKWGGGGSPRPPSLPRERARQHPTNVFD